VKQIIGLLVSFLFICMVGIAWKFFIFIKGPTQSPSDSVVFEVSKGLSFRSIAELLEEKGIVTDKDLLIIYARFTGYGKRLRAGEYMLDKSSSPRTVLEILSSGKSIQHLVTFPEGINIFEIASQLEKLGFGSARDFVKLAHDKKLIYQLLKADLRSFEGYLFPETYGFTKYTSQREIVEVMVNRFLEVYSEISKGAVNAMGRHTAVTLASIVEKETGAGPERARIASVFFNRLRKGMRLQSDPTILYGIMEKTGEMKMNITRDDLKEYTAYNTYRVDALPAGPIANPGKEALRATLNPENSNYLYFVSRNDGTHVFSESLQDHNQAVRTFQLDPQQREGKSWRNLRDKKSASHK
jgi:UPF0755 protein